MSPQSYKYESKHLNAYVKVSKPAEKQQFCVLERTYWSSISELTSFRISIALALVIVTAVSPWFPFWNTSSIAHCFLIAGRRGTRDESHFENSSKTSKQSHNSQVDELLLHLLSHDLFLFFSLWYLHLHLVAGALESTDINLRTLDPVDTHTPQFHSITIYWIGIYSTIEAYSLTKFWTKTG